MLVRRDGVSEALAMFAARASQGHIGRARALASDESTRNRRHEVLSLPGRLADVGSCITAAANLVEAAAEEAGPIAGDLEARERADLEQAYGVGVKGTRPRGAAAAIRGSRPSTRAAANGSSATASTVASSTSCRSIAT